MKHRRVTVTSTSVEQRVSRFPRRTLPPMPFVRLRGRWLDQAGFAIGQAVRVVVSAGVIVLEALPGEAHAERD